MEKNKPKIKELFDNIKLNFYLMLVKIIIKIFKINLIILLILLLIDFFVAPETKKEDNYNEQWDIYSVGILPYYIITGKITYINFSLSDLKDHILNNKSSNEFNDPLFENISSQGKNLIKSMVNKN